MVLQSVTDTRWLPQALLHFDAVLLDHAHCEHKAAASAMSMVAAYPQHSRLVRRCTKLAQEELRHFYQVHAILLRRGLSLQRDPGDPYVRTLLTLIRSGVRERLLDRLLLSSLIEARSCERLALLGQAIPDATIAKFYKALATAEAGHHRLFVDLANHYADPDDVQQRLHELAAREAQILAEQPIEPRIH